MTDPLKGEERYLQTKFWVNANSYARHQLWEDHGSYFIGQPEPPPYIWEQISCGEMVTVGMLDKRPICIEVQWYYINGVRVGFYYGCSQLVDHEMIEKWFTERYPVKYGGGRRAMTNDMNFHHCLHALKELKDG